MRAILGLSLLLVGLGCGPDYLTVAQAVKQRGVMSGQRVRVRGWAVASLDNYLVGCGPDPCCEPGDGDLMLKELQHATWLGGTDPFIHIMPVLCSGTICTLTCSPFSPWAAPAFELVGTLTGPPYATDNAVLEDLDISSSRQLTGSGDLDTLTARPLDSGKITVNFPPS